MAGEPIVGKCTISAADFNVAGTDKGVQVIDDGDGIISEGDIFISTVNGSPLAKTSPRVRSVLNPLMDECIKTKTRAVLVEQRCRNISGVTEREECKSKLAKYHEPTASMIKVANAFGVTLGMPYPKVSDGTLSETLGVFDQTSKYLGNVHPLIPQNAILITATTAEQFLAEQLGNLLKVRVPEQYKIPPPKK